MAKLLHDKAEIIRIAQAKEIEQHKIWIWLRLQYAGPIYGDLNTILDKIRNPK